MRKWLVLGGLVLAMCGQARGAATISAESDMTYPWQRWITRSKVPTPDIEITIVGQPCPDGESAACTFPGSTVAYIAEPSPSLAKDALFHELGHQFDYWVLTEAQRERFMQIAEVGGEWRQPGTRSPHELFAEAFRQCATGVWNGAPGRSLSPNRHQAKVIRDMKQACFFFRHLP